MDEFIYHCLECQHIIKLFHWNTKAYSEHIASDTLHEKLLKNIDKFVEVYLGHSGGRMTKLNSKLTLSIKKSRELQTYLHTYIKDFVEISLTSDLSNIRDEIISDINQFLYLLTLK